MKNYGTASILDWTDEIDKMKENIIDYNFDITSKDRAHRLNQSPLLLWFTGLSGSGKSTLSNAVEGFLFEKGFTTYALDGDNTRMGLNSNLGFSSEDRKENIRRIGEVSKLMLDAGLIVCASFVSPFKADRDRIKEIVGKENIVEIFVSTPLEECEKRDVKGLYKKARLGEISDFTGISSPYEAPEDPDINIDTTNLSIAEAINKIYNQIESKLK
jgi:adenylyl-sulfate kinase